MKKLLTLIIVASLALTIQAQDITNKLSTTGDFKVDKNDGTTNLFTLSGDEYHTMRLSAAQKGFTIFNEHGNAIFQVDDPYSVDDLGVLKLGKVTTFWLNPITDFPNLLIQNSVKPANISLVTIGTDARNRLQAYSAKGTSGSPSTVLTGNGLLSILGFGYNGSSYEYGAAIHFLVDGDVLTTHVPTKIDFYTGTNTAIPANRMTIKNDGVINIDGLSDVGNGTASVQVDENGNLVRGTGTGATSIDGLSDAEASNSNVFLGLNTGSLTSGSHNVALGLDALAETSAGIYNAAFGASALNANTGSYNVAIGTNSLSILSSGSNNIALGVGAGNQHTGGSDNILIGGEVEVSSNTVSNELNIGKLIYGTNVYNATGKVGIGNGNNAPSSTLDVGGSMELPLTLKNADYTLTDTDYTIVVGGSNHTITLPTPVQGRIYVIKNGSTASGTIIEATSGKSIDGSQTQTLTAAYDFIMLQAVGTSQWIIISKN